MNTHYVKISFFGDRGVGKTSVSDRFFKNEFSDRYIPCFSIDVDVKLKMELSSI